MKTYRGIELKGELKKIAKGKYEYCGRIIENKRVYSSWYNKIARRHVTAFRNQWVVKSAYLESLTDGIELVNEWVEEAEQEIIAEEPQPKFKVGDKIQMIDNEDCQIEVAIVYYSDFFETFIYCEGDNEYDGTIKEEDAVLVGDTDENSVLNIYQRLLNE